MKPLTEQGSDGFANGICLLVKEAMVRGRSSALRAEPYQRSEGRLSHANGYKDKSLSTRVGRITFDVPQAIVTAITLKHDLTGMFWGSGLR